MKIPNCGSPQSRKKSGFSEFCFVAYFPNFCEALDFEKNDDFLKNIFCVQNTKLKSQRKTVFFKIQPDLERYT